MIIWNHNLCVAGSFKIGSRLAKNSVLGCPFFEGEVKILSLWKNAEINQKAVNFA